MAKWIQMYHPFHADTCRTRQHGVSVAKKNRFFKLSFETETVLFGNQQRNCGTLESKHQPKNGHSSTYLQMSHKIPTISYSSAYILVLAAKITFRKQMIAFSRLKLKVAFKQNAMRMWIFGIL